MHLPCLKPAFLLLAALPAAVLLATSGGARAATACEALAGVALPQTTITAAQLIPAGTYQPPGGPVLQGLPEFCRVAGRIQNHPTSRITFEVWLPTRAANRRFAQVGNSAFAGAIRYEWMAPRLRAGYATANTDGGTSPAPGVAPAARLTAIGDFERLHDYRGRATVLTAKAAKTLYRSFYGSDPEYAYFTGGSSGGFEALAVAQRLGDQFDGVAAGCPQNNSAAVFTQGLWTARYYPKIAGKLGLIHQAALAACDEAADGVKDGVIGDPEHCRFDPAVLACRGADQPDCLTADQVDAVRRIYAGPVDPRTGKKSGEQYGPGMPIGSEHVWNLSNAQATNSAQPWFGMILHRSLTFDMGAFDFGEDAERALRLTQPHGAQATSTDLSAFRKRGGKLLLWAGWNDPYWSQAGIVDYYKRITAQAGDFARLFMAPGAGHCGEGEGPNVFDTFGPLVEWVERGKVPQQLAATKYVNNQPAQGVERTRPICAYPRVARWTGRGDPARAEHFECVQPGR